MTRETLTIVKYFNQRTGLFPTLGYGISLLCGQKKMGVTEHGTLVQTSLRGNPKKVGERILGLYDPDPKKSITRVFNGDNVPEDKRHLLTLNPTKESLQKIDSIIEDVPMREIVKGRLQKYAQHDQRFGGELTQLDVYRFQNPEEHDDAKYMIFENAGILLQNRIYIISDSITTHTPEGEVIKNTHSNLSVRHQNMERKYKALDL